MTSKRGDLTFLGEDYQYILVHEFLSDNEFFSDLHDMVDPNMFTSYLLKDIVRFIQDWYDDYGLLIDYTTLRIKVRERYSDYQLDSYLAAIDKIEATSTVGSDYNRGLAMKFFKQQAIIKTANEILRIAARGATDSYDEMVERLTKVVQTTGKHDLGTGVYDDISETLSDDYRTTIPTGIDKIDETLEGGLGKEELGVIIGPSSYGKTSMTSAIAAYAATNGNKDGRGFKVLQIVFEDRPKQIKRKHMGYITGIEAKDLSKPEYIDEVKELLENYDKKDMLMRNLRILRLPSGEVTPDDIKRVVIKETNSGFRPDLLIVDYFECLKMVGDSSTTSEWEKEGKTMRKFESMAGEMNLAIWIPLQGTKDSVNADLVTMDKAGGSFKKIQIAHIVVSIARSVDDISNNKASIAILKNRAGQAGKVFENVDFNNGTCRISTDNAVEFSSMTRFNDNKDNKKFAQQKNLMKKFDAVKEMHKTKQDPQPPIDTEF
jgi:replicative DNA helicase